MQLLYLIPSPAPNDHMADSSHTYNSIKGYLTRIIKSYEWKFHNFVIVNFMCIYIVRF